MQAIAHSFGSAGAALYLRGRILDTWPSYALLFLTTVGALSIINGVIDWCGLSSPHINGILYDSEDETETDITGDISSGISLGNIEFSTTDISTIENNDSTEIVI